MEVIKIIKNAYQVTQASEKPFMKFGTFREARERLGLSVERRCFRCGHKFKDDEDVYLILFRGTLNHLFCNNCNEQALNDLRKGGGDEQTAE